MKPGFQENVTVDEGTSAAGIRTQFHFEGDYLIVQRTYDAEPDLEFANAMRQAQEGERWGNGMRHVARIPMAQYAKFLAIADPRERMKAMKAYVRENSRFSTFAPWLKG